MYSIVANFLLPLVLLAGSYLFLGGTIAPDLNFIISTFDFL